MLFICLSSKKENFIFIIPFRIQALFRSATSCTYSAMLFTSRIKLTSFQFLAQGHRYLEFAVIYHFITRVMIKELGNYTIRICFQSQNISQCNVSVNYALHCLRSCYIAMDTRALPIIYLFHPINQI